MTRNDSAREHRDTPSRSIGMRVAALATALILVGACEGENIFVEDITPPAVEILDPASGDNVAPEDSVLVRVAVSDRRGVERVRMAAIDPRSGQQVDWLSAHEALFTPPLTDGVLETHLSTMAMAGTEPVTLVVSAWDQAGNLGVDSVHLRIGGPRVSILMPTAAQQVRAGTNLTIEVAATDDLGIDQIVIELGGAINETVPAIRISPVQESVVVEHTVRPTETGQLTITARARNTDGVTNRSAPVQVTVTSSTALDETPPQVALDVVAPARAELADSLRFMVRAQDDDGGTGVAGVGVTVIAVSGRAHTLAWSDFRTLDPAQSGVREQEFVVAVNQLYRQISNDFASNLTLPDTLQLEFHAFAWDAATPRNCAAATGASFAQIPCQDITVAGVSVTVAENTTGRSADVVVVDGQTVMLPKGGVIADAVVDATRQQLFLSNFTFNRVERLDLRTLRFDPTGVDVGAQPWGMSMDTSGHRLIVANSGGTNLDFIDLNAPVLRADLANRLQTPNIVLFQITQREDEGGRLRYTGSWIDFSDRPQFVTQDASGRLLYSTVPTPAAADGTIRVLYRDPTWDRLETEILLIDATVENADSYAVANIEGLAECSMPAEPNTFGVVLQYRIPGQRQLWHSSCLPPSEAYEEVRQNQRAAHGLGEGDPEVDAGIVFHSGRAWVRARIGWSDTTFVAASGDRNRVVFGEGARDMGRVVMWDAQSRTTSANTSVADLIHNEPARITGVDLNANGAMGIARGQEGAYFFDANLRLLGRAVEGVGGGAGAAIHPSHSGAGAGLSFVGTNRNSIQVLDVGHFVVRGEISIRDQIVGPLRVSLPLPDDPVDTVVRVYGVTSSGGVVLIRVREGHIRP
jgi:hypothetical protein